MLVPLRKELIDAPPDGEGEMSHLGSPTSGGHAPRNDAQEPLDLLSLPPAVIEQIARVRLDTPIVGSFPGLPRKTYAFWILLGIGHPGLKAAAWDARHSVVRPTLRNVALLGDEEWCHVMLAGGADVEAVDRNHRCGVYMYPDICCVAYSRLHVLVSIPLPCRLPQHWAADLGHTDAVARLLEYGSAVDDKDDNGMTALHIAADGGHTALGAVLLQHGANINARDRGGGLRPCITQLGRGTRPW